MRLFWEAPVRSGWGQEIAQKQKRESGFQMPREACLVTVDFDSKRAAVRKRKGSAEIVTRKVNKESSPLTDDLGKTALKRPAVTTAGGLNLITFSICKESMRPVKKALKQLELLKDLPLEQQVRSARTQVLTIGEHVSTCLAEYSTAQEARYWKRYLWKFASIFSEHNARTLRRLYKYSQVNQEDKFMKTYWGTGFPGPAQVQSLECKQLYNAWGLPVDSSSSDLGRGQSAVEDQHLTDRHTDGSLPGRVHPDTAAADWLVVFQLPSDFCSLLRHFHYT
ncbi:hypothetical protein AOXY_G23049 [Acipenser oxyrinchus oxyrinchus]|uniref:Chromodomain-helicase-DNA-binding protein 1-like C-terminal domain-containing protein n=1 Tax=Acipenser oxyrinchus oxyrinchus TaxID=40147 RepID=A0AAD8G056_ACIOX|nr:hypothetical protein AOXY_G23049 [Acipenser oxyrinchus oxyrinchus]